MCRPVVQTFFNTFLKTVHTFSRIIFKLETLCLNIVCKLGVHTLPALDCRAVAKINKKKKTSERHTVPLPLVPSSFGGGGSWSDENCTQNAAGARCRCRRASDGHTSLTDNNDDDGDGERRYASFFRVQVCVHVEMDLGPVLWKCVL